MSKPLAFEDVLAARLQDPQKLNGVSLRYARQSVGEGDCFALLSAWLPGRRRKTNEEAHDILIHALQTAGLTVQRLDGRWQRAGGKKAGPVWSELYLFVSGIPLSQARDFSERLGGADSFLWAGPETEGALVRVHRSGARTSLGAFSPEKISADLTATRAGQATFLGFTYRPTGWAANLAEMAFVKEHGLG